MSDFKQEFYTVPEAADVLKVHENTVYNMCRQRQIEYYKVGAQIRISAAELERMKQERENKITSIRSSRKRGDNMAKSEELREIEKVLVDRPDVRSLIKEAETLEPDDLQQVIDFIQERKEG